MKKLHIRNTTGAACMTDIQDEDGKRVECVEGITLAPLTRDGLVRATLTFLLPTFDLVAYPRREDLEAELARVATHRRMLDEAEAVIRDLLGQKEPPTP